MGDETRAFLKDILVKISVGLIAALTVYVITAKGVKIFDVSMIEPFTTGLNLIVVLAFCIFSLGVPKLKFVGLYLPAEMNSLIRVNRLMKQLNFNILLYAFCLVVVYSIYFADSLLGLGEKGFQIDELTNLFNFLSSLFIYLSFKVLYDKTLDKEGDPNFYYMDAVVFALIGIGTYFILTDARTLNSTAEQIAIIKKNFSLIIGILNSLAMGLLFSRFISMENVLMNLFETDKQGRPNRNQKIFIKNIMIFLLPLYAAVQPIFGNFNLEVGLGNPAIHRNIVFLICFFGKALFLSIYLYYSHRRWIHIYLYSMLNRQGIPYLLKDKFILKETYWEEGITPFDELRKSDHSEDLTKTGSI